MQHWPSSRFDTRRGSRDPDATSWHTARASAIMVAIVVAALVVWLAYALNWLP